MKFQSTISLLSLALSSVVTAAPGVSVESDSAFPIGFSKHKNARAVGRLFEIDGKVQYFAGELLWSSLNSYDQYLTNYRNQCLVARSLELQQRCGHLSY